MISLLDTESATDWDATKLERVQEKLFEHGTITAFEATLVGIEAPDEDAFASPTPAPEATISYRVTYESDAARKPATLEGELVLTYDSEADAWAVRWGRSAYLPDIDDARDFGVSYKWLGRGEILDRKGRALATGTAAEREYPYGSVAGTTIGHIEPLEKAALMDGARGQLGDLVGGSGLEEGLDDILAGTPTTTLNVVDRKDEPLETLGRVKGHPGKDVKTTLDMDVQRAAEAGYGSTTGGAVVIAPATGDVLAVVSSSPFDPNNYVGVPGIEPFNRALSGLYPPGSSMKVVTASAALDTGVVEETTTLSGPAEYRGVRNFESEQFASLTFAEAVKFSVNTAFAQVAEDLGPKRLTRYAKAFGFDKAPTMPIDAATSSFPFPADEGDLLWSSVGQAQVLATPLGMASVAATVANGGERMEPRIVLKDDEVGKRAISKHTATVMTRLMQGVVTGGTGSAANISGLGVAGKTGTAEVDVNGERRNHAWFVCFAPGDNPKVAVAVVSEYGGVGGQVAAPLARQILLGVLPFIG
jgi:peptidoglycan glycosyltransferase